MEEERLHDRLKKRMKELNISQRRLSLMTGISEASICKYVSGARTPHIEIIGKLATALNTTSDYLLGINEKENDHYSLLEKCIEENKEFLTMEEKMSLIMKLSEK